MEEVEGVARVGSTEGEEGSVAAKVGLDEQGSGEGISEDAESGSDEEEKRYSLRPDEGIAKRLSRK